MFDWKVFAKAENGSKAAELGRLYVAIDALATLGNTQAEVDLETFGWVDALFLEEPGELWIKKGSVVDRLVCTPKGNTYRFVHKESSVEIDWRGQIAAWSKEATHSVGDKIKELCDAMGGIGAEVDFQTYEAIHKAFGLPIYGDRYEFPTKSGARSIFICKPEETTLSWSPFGFQEPKIKNQADFEEVARVLAHNKLPMLVVLQPETMKLTAAVFGMEMTGPDFGFSRWAKSGRLAVFTARDYGYGDEVLVAGTTYAGMRGFVIGQEGYNYIVRLERDRAGKALTHKHNANIFPGYLALACAVKLHVIPDEEPTPIKEPDLTPPPKPWNPFDEAVPTVTNADQVAAAAKAMRKANLTPILVIPSGQWQDLIDTLDIMSEEPVVEWMTPSGRTILACEPVLKYGEEVTVFGNLCAGMKGVVRGRDERGNYDVTLIEDSKGNGVSVNACFPAYQLAPRAALDLFFSEKKPKADWVVRNNGYVALAPNPRETLHKFVYVDGVPGVGPADPQLRVVTGHDKYVFGRVSDGRITDLYTISEVVVVPKTTYAIDGDQFKEWSAAVIDSTKG